MPYDKYKDWPLPRKVGNIFPVMQSSGIEAQVLKDLEEAKDEIDKLEILDSFAAYAERAYRQDFAETAAALTGQQLGALLEPVFLSRMPSVAPMHRGRPVLEEDTVKD